MLNLPALSVEGIAVPECYQCGEPAEPAEGGERPYKRGDKPVCFECYRHRIPVPPSNTNLCCICQHDGGILWSAGEGRVSSRPSLTLFFHHECRADMDQSWPAYAATWQTTPQAIEAARRQRAEAKAKAVRKQRAEAGRQKRRELREARAATQRERSQAPASDQATPDPVPTSLKDRTPGCHHHHGNPCDFLDKLSATLHGTRRTSRIYRDEQEIAKAFGKARITIHRNCRKHGITEGWESLVKRWVRDGCSAALGVRCDRCTANDHEK